MINAQRRAKVLYFSSTFLVKKYGLDNGSPSYGKPGLAGCLFGFGRFTIFYTASGLLLPLSPPLPPSLDTRQSGSSSPVAKHVRRCQRPNKNDPACVTKKLRLTWLSTSEYALIFFFFQTPNVGRHAPPESSRENYGPGRHVNWALV